MTDCDFAVACGRCYKPVDLNSGVVLSCGDFLCITCANHCLRPANGGCPRCPACGKDRINSIALNDSISLPLEVKRNLSSISSELESVYQVILFQMKYYKRLTLGLLQKNSDLQLMCTQQQRQIEELQTSCDKQLRAPLRQEQQRSPQFGRPMTSGFFSGTSHSNGNRSSNISPSFASGNGNESGSGSGVESGTAVVVSQYDTGMQQQQLTSTHRPQTVESRSSCTNAGIAQQNRQQPPQQQQQLRDSDRCKLPASSSSAVTAVTGAATAAAAAATASTPVHRQSPKSVVPMAPSKMYAPLTRPLSAKRPFTTSNCYSGYTPATPSRLRSPHMVPAVPPQRTGSSITNPQQQVHKKKFQSFVGTSYG